MKQERTECTELYVRRMQNFGSNANIPENDILLATLAGLKISVQKIILHHEIHSLKDINRWAILAGNIGKDEQKLEAVKQSSCSEIKDSLKRIEEMIARSETSSFDKLKSPWKHNTSTQKNKVWFNLQNDQKDEENKPPVYPEPDLYWRDQHVNYDGQGCYDRDAMNYNGQQGFWTNTTYNKESQRQGWSNQKSSFDCNNFDAFYNCSTTNYPVYSDLSSKMILQNNYRDINALTNEKVCPNCARFDRVEQLCPANCLE